MVKSRLIFFVIPLILCSLHDPLYSMSFDQLPVYYLNLVNEEQYIYRSDIKGLNWHEIRKLRELNKTSGKRVKFFELIRFKTNKPGSKSYDEIRAFVRDPNGTILKFNSELKKEYLIKTPEDENLIGRYLIGANVSSGHYDLDGDGSEESIMACAKYITTHYKNGGTPGTKSVVFFDNNDLMPLEIGPVVNTAISKFSGGSHRPHRYYELMVKYMGEPLAGAMVEVIAMDSKWHKIFITDKYGKFKIMPPDDRSIAKEWQKYLYTTCFNDHQTKKIYISTLSIIVYKNRPEWRSKTMGYTLWTIFGTGLFLVLIVMLVQRKKILNRKTMVVFENNKINRDKR